MAAGIARVVADPDGIRLVVVGPPGLSADLLASHGVDPASVDFEAASRVAAMDSDPLRAVREHPDLTVNVATELVRTRVADASVSLGHTGATVAAAALRLGRLPGFARPALAVVVPSIVGPVVLTDAGAAPDATAAVLRQFALAGWAYACSIGIENPGVGLVSIGSESGKGDRLRKAADELLATTLPAAGVHYVGTVEGHDVALGARARVFVTDGFTGNVLLKGMEGAITWAAQRMSEAYGSIDPAERVIADATTGEFAGGMLLGVDGVTVVGHGASSPQQVEACIRSAAGAVRTGLVQRTQELLARMVGT